LPSLNSLQVVSNWLYEDNFLVKKAVHRADGLFAASHLVANLAREKYQLDQAPIFLPTPVEIPPKIEKANIPTVCFVSRLDRRKRPEFFCRLAESFPDVHFIAAGKSRNPAYEQSLHAEFVNLPNLEMLGFINQFDSRDLSKVFEKSWILIHPAAREGLPIAFVEAAAHGCAILSAVDPDGFSTRFGYRVLDDDFAAGLRTLLKDDHWKELGSLGRKYVSEVFSLERAIDKHLLIYEQWAGSSLHTIIP
jgi:glycosyltransferase involved in cell wall biosynthesis